MGGKVFKFECPETEESFWATYLGGQQFSSLDDNSKYTFTTLNWQKGKMVRIMQVAVETHEVFAGNSSTSGSVTAGNSSTGSLSELSEEIAAQTVEELNCMPGTKFSGHKKGNISGVLE